MKDQVLMSVPYSPPPAPRTTEADGVLMSKPYSPPPNAVAPPAPGAEAAASPEDLALGTIRPASAVLSAQEKRDWTQLVPAYAVSLVVHFLLLILFLKVSVVGTAPELSSALEEQVIETKVDDPKAEDLTNVEVGIDPEVPTNYNVARIEEVSVPGPVNPNEAIGIVGAPEGPPATLPPPPGMGNGQGGGHDGGTGTANPFGAPGGLPGGIKLVPGGFGGRSGSTREQMLREGGGNTRSEAAVALGLLWLSLHQGPHGNWSLQGFAKDARCNCTNSPSCGANDIAATAFGLLPFLGAGESHRGTGKNSRYGKIIERGLRYLIANQNAQGSFSGDMYAQGLASIAVCEAYGVSSDPMLKGPAQRAINFIAEAQNPTGGWDYSPKGPTPDMSIGAWHIMALKSGQMSGLVVPRATLQQANRWLDQWAGDNYGSIYGYRQPNARQPDEGGASPQTMVAAGLLCRMYLGWGPNNPGLAKSVGWFMQPINMPLKANRRHMYYWYYATQVLHHMGGPPWQKWNANMRDLLIEEQDQGRDPRTSHQKGSWDPTPDWWCAYGGRIMVTSMSLLTLEVYYRHLPLYRREQGGFKD